MAALGCSYAVRTVSGEERGGATAGRRHGVGEVVCRRLRLLAVDVRLNVNKAASCQWTDHTSQLHVATSAEPVNRKILDVHFNMKTPKLLR